MKPDWNTDQIGWGGIVDELHDEDIVESYSFDPARMAPSVALFAALDRVDEWGALDVSPLYDHGIDMEALDQLSVESESADSRGGYFRTDGGCTGSIAVSVLLRVEQYVFNLDPVVGLVDVYERP